MQNFIWSTVDYNLDDQTAANIGKFYLENVPDALHVACCYRQQKHNVSFSFHINNLVFKIRIGFGLDNFGSDSDFKVY